MVKTKTPYSTCRQRAEDTMMVIMAMSMSELREGERAAPAICIHSF